MGRSALALHTGAFHEVFPAEEFFVFNCTKEQPIESSCRNAKHEEELFLESDCCDVTTLFFQMNFSLMGSFWVFENRKRENAHGDEFV